MYLATGFHHSPVGRRNISAEDLYKRTDQLKLHMLYCSLAISKTHCSDEWSEKARTILAVPALIKRFCGLKSRLQQGSSDKLDIESR